MIKMFIDNEEVVSDREFAINEEMLSASSTILNNCYPKSWELNKDYISNFYYPKDYSKFLLGEGEFEHGDEEYGVLNVSGETFMQYETNVEKEWNSFNVYGNTTQEIRSGKNLINILGYHNVGYSETVNGLTITYQNDGSIKVNGTASANTTYILYQGSSILPAGQYTFSGSVGGSYSTYRLEATVTPSYTYFHSVNGKETLTLSSQQTLWRVYLIVQSGTQLSNKIFYPMLEKGNTATEYEPYGVMPSPDYPSELISVGYENLFDFSQIINNTNRGLTWNYESGKLNITGTATATYSQTNQFNINLPSGTYRFNFFGDTNLPYNIWLYNSNGTLIGNTKVNNPLTINETATKFALFVENLTSGTLYNESITVQITKGTQVHSYIPYGKYGIEVKTTGKNLHNGVSTNKYAVSSTGEIRDGNARDLGFENKIIVQPNTTYTVKFYDVLGNYSFFYSTYDNNNNFIRRIQISSTNGTATFTTDSETHYIFGWLYSTSDTFTTIGTNIQLEKGTRATEYEEYKENTQVYQLDEPLRAIGNIKDRLYIENGMLFVDRKIGKVVFNGTETEWTFSNASAYPFRINISDAEKLTQSQAVAPNVMVNYYTPFYWNISDRPDYGVTSSTNTILAFRNIDITSLANFKTWLSTHNTEVQYPLAEPYKEVIGQFDIPYSYDGINNITFDTGIDTEETVYYYWKNFNVLFAGIVKNSGDISLNPRYPHYCSLQILDYKTFLSESNTLDFVIANKTVKEAINMVVNAVKNYGFVVGDINISGADDIIGAYSTLNKSAYDVLQYLANISGSKWRARYVNSSTMAIDFYDPDTLPQAEDIEYTKEYWENNNIVDMTFNYGTRDYRNKQILLSDEVYANINYDETLISNGYGNTFTVQNNIGLVVSVIVNNQEKTVGTNNDKQMGIDADFYYTPGKNIIESNMIYPASTLIHLTYQPLVKGRQIVYNNSEVDRISRQTDTEGVIARYETRNDILSSDELEKIAQTYIEYKGKAEVILTLKTQNKDLYNIGEVVYFNAPIDELKQNYMVKTKQIEYVVINDIINLFYIYEMTSSFNSEKAINYFDNQRNKASGNIADGESITRNIDIETGVGIIWTEGSVSSTSVTVTGDNLLNSALNSPFVE